MVNSGDDEIVRVLCARYASDLDEYMMFAKMMFPTRPRLCDSCGSRLRADNKYGACTRNPECRRVHQRRQWRALHGKPASVLDDIPGLRRIA